MSEGFITPNGHTGFLAKKLFDKMGNIQWGAIAYIEKNGGGSVNNHTHSDNHLFIVVDDEVRIVMGKKEMVVVKKQAVFVDGMMPHSIWNNGDNTAVVIKISTERNN